MQHYSGQTLRLIVHTSLGGPKVRVAFTNLYGDVPLVIGNAHIALRSSDARIDPATERALRFRGRGSVSIPAHGMAVSDPADFPLPPDRDLAISLYLPGPTAAATAHVLALQTSYVSPPGDWSAAPDLPIERKIRSWPFLAAVAVAAPPGSSGAVIAFGDSLVDGDGSSADGNARWPDRLAQRLRAAGQPLSVLNEGIIANRLLSGPAPEMLPQFGGIPGEAGLARFRRDALALGGVRCAILRIGSNDIGFPGSLTPASQKVSADQLVDGYERLVRVAHARGVRVIGMTIPPFEGATLAPDLYSEEKDAVRRRVNDWMRHGRAFDGLVDIDLVLRDASHPSRLMPGYDSGDHLHPNDAGYRAIADAVPLSLVSRQCGRRARSQSRRAR